MTRRVGMAAVMAASQLACTTIDPGSDPSIPLQTFDADFFYCHVWPELIVAKSCGTGDPSQDRPNSCHFTPSAVSGMALLDLQPAVDCGGGDHPVDLTKVGSGSPAQEDLQAVSFEMSRDYQTAPLFVRPSGYAHPRSVFSQGDPQVNQLLATWASK